MNTEVIRVDPSQPDPAAIARAAEVLARGGLVVLPTETVYGLGARADDERAVARVFEAKGRPAYNPLIVHVASVGEAMRCASRWPESAARLAEAFWPGPLTVVVARRRGVVVEGVSAGGETVALRMPAHAVTLAVLRALGVPIAAPSANRFQTLSPTTAEHVLKGLDGRVDLVLDAGACVHGIESTVVRCDGGLPVVLRPGAVSSERLRAAVGELGVCAEVSEDGSSVLPSPGMIRKHYAPRARVMVVRADALEEAVRATEGVVGVVARTSVIGVAGERMRVLAGDADGYGAGLYAALHALDDAGCDVAIVEELPDGDAWAAVRDRLARAMG